MARLLLSAETASVVSIWLATETGLSLKGEYYGHDLYDVELFIC